MHIVWSPESWEVKVNRPVVGPRVLTNELSWFISYGKPPSNVGKEELMLASSWWRNAKDERVVYTYSDFNENAHPRILLILLLPLVPFERTILPWFVLSQRSASSK